MLGEWNERWEVLLIVLERKLLNWDNLAVTQDLMI